VSIVVAWAADEGTGTTVADYSGNGHTGNVEGAIAWVAGHPPHTYATQGEAGNAPAIWLENTLLFSGSRTCTLMCWVYAVSYTGTGDLIEIRSTLDDSTTAFTIFRPSKTTLQTEFHDSGGATTDTTPVTATTTGVWNHIAAVLSETTLTLYLNGTAVASTPVAGSGSLGDVKFFYAGGTNTKYNQGRVNDVRLFDTALTAAEVTSLMNTPVGVYTGQGAFALPSPAATATGTTAPAFTGTGSLSLPPLTATGAGEFVRPSYTGTGALTLPSPTAAGAGAAIAPAATGTGTFTLPGLSAAGDGTTTRPAFTGDGALTLPTLTAIGDGASTTPGVTGAGLLELPALAGDGHGQTAPPAFTGDGSVTLPALGVEGAGAIGSPTIAGSGVLVVPSLEAVGAGTVTVPDIAGAGVLVLPALQVTGHDGDVTLRDITVRTTPLPVRWGTTAAGARYTATSLPNRWRVE
jgi:hypothetical protein